jgi:VanZ family protein
MSLLSGDQSGGISSNLSVSIKSIIDSVFVNNNITLEGLHIFIRKAAHVVEYLLLGVSYFFTAKYWKLSILKVLALGLLTATADELLQNIPADRSASALDIFLYDFGGFIIGFGILILLFNKVKEEVETEQVLSLLSKGEISPRKAYKDLYNSKNVIRFTNRAHFLKLRVIIPGEKGVNTLLRVLFFIPIPLFIFRFAMQFVNIDKYDIPFSKAEMLDMITSKGISINVNAASNEKVIIKTI